jgi:hypothetical protein
MKNKVHLVLDIETLSAEKNALILSIGYAIVKDCEVRQTGQYRLNMAQQKHRHISHDTIKWWLQGDKADAQRSLSSLPEVDCNVAMAALTSNVCVFSAWRDVLVWGNSPNFDCDILGDYLKDVGKYEDKPWRFWNERDMRTMHDMSGVKRHHPGTPHDAASDALAEAEGLCEYLRTLP